MKEPNALNIGNLVYRVSYRDMLYPYTVNHVTPKCAYLNFGSKVQQRQDYDIKIPKFMTFRENYSKFGYNFGDCYTSPSIDGDFYVLANSNLNQLYYTYTEIDSQVEKKLKTLTDVAQRLRTNLTEDDNMLKLQTLNNLLSDALEYGNV